jgi:Transposase and inactivated derivatives
MYKVLSKDIIENEILPHLSTAKRGFKTKSCLSEVINCILYKLKTGVQWHMLPVNSLFSEIVLSYKTVYGHFRKWSKNGEWENLWSLVLDKNRLKLDLSTSSIDGSHTKALRGGEEVEFQTRKMSKTTNSLYLTDNQGLPIAISSPVSGNHHDLYEIEERLDELFLSLKNANISIDGLFVNADAGFDSRKFRDKCSEYGVIANTALNPRNGSENEDVLFDELLYEQRYTIERTNAWMDSYRTLLNRFDTTVSSWKSFNYIAFIIIIFKNINKKQKSR